MEKKKREFKDNDVRKKRISNSMKVYHHTIRHGGLNENCDTSDDMDENQYIKITSGIQSLFVRLIDMIEQRRDLLNTQFSPKEQEPNKNNGRKIFISPQQRDRLFQPDEQNEQNGND